MGSEMCIRDRSTPEQREAFFVDAVDASEQEFFNRLSEARRRRVLMEPHNDANFWESDHVRAVADGGGEADMGNYQTLCHACHREKTRGVTSRRCAARLRASRSPAAKGTRCASEIGPTQLRVLEKRRRKSVAQAEPHIACCAKRRCGRGRGSALCREAAARRGSAAPGCIGA